MAVETKHWNKVFHLPTDALCISLINH